LSRNKLERLSKLGSILPRHKDSQNLAAFWDLLTLDLGNLSVLAEMKDSKDCQNQGSILGLVETFKIQKNY
jgi:hypothetical protein